VAVRFAWELTVPRIVRSHLTSWNERVALGFTGLRGAVSVAAALSVPQVVDGTPFPDRGTVVAAAIAAIVVLLVGPALTLRPVLRALGLVGGESEQHREREVRAALAEAALARAEEVAAQDDVPEDVLDRVRERYELRLLRYADEEHPPSEDRARLYKRLYRETAQAQRDKLAQLRRDGEVHGRLLRDLERDLDVEALRAR
jgi:CPA1 family monovalent cation:H+ antiporter